MRPISRWTHLMSSRVGISLRTCQDGYGKPVYGTATTYRAHLARKRQIVRNQGGQDVESMQALYLATTDVIPETARVTLSTADAGSTETYALHPAIRAVERRYDQRGPHHVVVYL